MYHCQGTEWRVQHAEYAAALHGVKLSDKLFVTLALCWKYLLKNMSLATRRHLSTSSKDLVC